MLHLFLDSQYRTQFYLVIIITALCGHAAVSQEPMKCRERLAVLNMASGCYAFGILTFTFDSFSISFIPDGLFLLTTRIHFHLAVCSL